MKVSFMGQVLEATCECHKGQWLTVAFLLHPVEGKVELGNNAWPDEETAKRELERFVQVAAEETLKIVGMNPEESKRTVFTGENAEKDFNKHLRESDTSLH